MEQNLEYNDEDVQQLIKNNNNVALQLQVIVLSRLLKEEKVKKNNKEVDLVES